MRLGILGGSFDPVHFGHLLLAESCLEQLRLDAVWFLPAATPPHKHPKATSPAEHRAAMLELAVAGNPAFAVCRQEIERGGINYTHEALARLHDEDPRRDLFFLLGADMFRDLPNWRDPRRVCELAVPVAAARPGEPPPDYELLAEFVPPERLAMFRRHRVEMPLMGLSGSEIRRRAAAGLSIRYQTPPAVVEYIGAHGLYGGQRVA
jgi:nicotinate-nucleotide adenylyltransferase